MVASVHRTASNAPARAANRPATPAEMNVITSTAPRAAMSQRDTMSRRRHSPWSIRGMTRSAWSHIATFIGSILADVAANASRRYARPMSKVAVYVEPDFVGLRSSLSPPPV
jgi:hypothetical protein